MSAVLIVDDNPSDRALFRAVLTRAGYAVHEVARGSDALEKAREVLPHIIVLDVNLPDTDGHSVCRDFRTDPQFAPVPILMLTVQHHEEDVIAGLEAGADDYISKDEAPQIILARVKRLVRYRQMATVASLNEGLAQVGRLLAGIVHEIRGPLSVIRGNAEILKLQLGVGNEAETRIEPIIRGCQLLQVRLEHLMATVRGGPAMLMAQDVGPLVREAVDLFHKGTDPRAGKIAIVAETVGGLPAVKADGGRLIQVLLNLLGNAHEAILGDRKEGRICVRSDLGLGDDGDGVVVQVIDDGPGIPATHLSRVFEPFYTTKATGSGYGLYLASEILREHGGRLSARNGDECGACFTIWLPLATVTAP
ncbi:MAG: signal transduction histidine kinase [Planctomycetota bacterium]|nr:signal transduction histidine kinase [Planctomycetota bacterium]